MKCNRFRVSLLSLCAAALLAGVATADDRDFVRKSSEDPYIFILLDVSGSMNWTTRCSAADLAAGKCRQLCTDKDCVAPLNADDPASKFYQAKEALYEVLQDVDDMNFGFATYNQDDLTVRAKHWLYRVASGGVSLDGTTFPAVGAQEVFGFLFNCDDNGANSNNANDNEIACYGNNTDAASLNDAWEMTRLHRVAKLGENGDQSTVNVYAQSGTHRFRITYKQVAGQTYGTATFKAKIDVKRCTDTSSNSADENCTSTDLDVATDLEITYDLVDEFLAWDSGPDRAEVERGFFAQGNGADTSAGDTCNGWDPNAWNAADTYEGINDDPPASGYNLRWPTLNLGDTRGKWFYEGDVIPMDWRFDQKADILKRLAPLPGRFDQSPLFNDHPIGAQNYLRLKNEADRPLLAFGSTPLGSSIQSFRTWYAGCPQGTCPNNSGWKDVAAAQDPNWGCRKKYLLVLTDGDESCGGGNSACNGTASLRAQEGIKTVVIAFGVPGGGTTLTCMAANGGTGTPFFPQNKQELIDVLNGVFNQVKEESRAFASAAVPSVEANVKDKIYLSDFTPLTDEAIWDGHLDAFLKPLPTNVDGTPKRTPTCSATITSNCHLWDVGEVLKPLAPTPADVAAGVFNLGLGPTNQRRVLYPTENKTLKLFRPPVSNNDWHDLFRGLGFANAGATNGDGTPLTANRTRATEIIGDTLVRKNATVDLADGTTVTIDYVMGDVFHSDPLVVESPSNFNDFASNTFGDTGRACDLSASTDRGYKCFAFKHQHRRKLLLVGANDSQLHAFDTGVFDKANNLYGNGTGIEAFSFIPRMTLPIVRELAEGTQQIFGVDGQIAVGDVYNYGDGEWHTVAMGGLREGGLKLSGGRVLQPESGAGSAPNGGGYYALDVTQPDRLEARTGAGGAITDFVPIVPAGASNASPPATTSIPGCLSLDGTTVSGCARPFPKLLFEFLDRNPNSPVAVAAQLDEDVNGAGDLGEPWSKPILTRIRVRQLDGAGNPVTVVKFVALVGGGFARGEKTATNPTVGNWIYIIDMETGQAIYKREVEGSVPAVSALDTNSDNIADFIYAGTTAGRVYKIDLRTIPTVSTVTVKDTAGNDVDVQRITAAAWNPLLVFITGPSPIPVGSTPPPIYLPIQLIFVSRLGGYALAIPTGDREDLWNFDSLQGRLYVLVDQDWSASTPGLPLNETQFKQFTPDDNNLATTTNLLLDPASVGASKPGWFMIFDPDERIITKPFGVSNVLIFSSFQPQIIIDEEGGGANAETFCSRTGTSRNFVVLTTNGNAIADLDADASTGVGGGGGPGGTERFMEIADFVTNPFVEQTQTQNASTTPPPAGGPPTADQCTTEPRLANIVNFLKSIGPSNARYGNYFLRLGQRESTRGIFYPACVPIGVVQANWKEN